MILSVLNLYLNILFTVQCYRQFDNLTYALFQICDVVKKVHSVSKNGTEYKTSIGGWRIYKFLLYFFFWHSNEINNWNTRQNQMQKRVVRNHVQNYHHVKCSCIVARFNISCASHWKCKSMTEMYNIIHLGSSSTLLSIAKNCHYVFFVDGFTKITQS